MLDADYAVVGVGTLGSFALKELAMGGNSVIGFDRYPPGHDKGSGHGGSRVFRTAYKEGVEYVPFTMAAHKLWKELNNESGKEILLETGNLMISDAENDILETSYNSAVEYALNYERLLEGWDAQNRFPQHFFQKGDVAHFDYAGGVLDPEAAIQTASQLAVDAGARLLIGGEVEKIETDSSGVDIYYDGGKYRVGHVIVSVGSWMDKLLPDLKLPLWIERQVMLWFRAKDPSIFLPDNFPVFSRETGNISWYGFPSLDGKTVKIALYDGGYPVEDPDTIDREAHYYDKEDLSRLVKFYIPKLYPEPVKSKVCMYTNAPDRKFLLSPTSKMENTTLLGGGSGHAFKFAPILGKLAAESAVGLEPSLDIELFKPE